MAKLPLQDTCIEGLKTFTRTPFKDDRGQFERLYCAEELKALDMQLCQMNRSITRDKGSIRGMHFQYPPHAERKIVSCLKGSVFDVAVDLRKGSSSFLHWYGKVLSADNGTSMAIPRGFAHGFQTLEPDCELLYLHDMPYRPEAEGIVSAFDNLLNIEWPVAVTAMSDRDRNAALLGTDFTGLLL